MSHSSPLSCGSRASSPRQPRGLRATAIRPRQRRKSKGPSPARFVDPLLVGCGSLILDGRAAHKRPVRMRQAGGLSRSERSCPIPHVVILLSADRNPGREVPGSRRCGRRSLNMPDDDTRRVRRHDPPHRLHRVVISWTALPLSRGSPRTPPARACRLLPGVRPQSSRSRRYRNASAACQVCRVQSLACTYAWSMTPMPR